MTCFDTVKPTYIEQWPDALRRLSIPSIDVPLTLADAKSLGANIYDYGETFGVPDNIDAIRQRVAAAVATFPAGAFVRLGSRSPKDSYLGYKDGFKIAPGDGDPLRLLLDCSERISNDLHAAIANDYPPHIWVREWLDIPPWSEFRCFMRGRQLVGISQYDYREGPFPEIAKYEWVIRHSIEVFFERHFLPAVHLDDVIFDIHCDGNNGVGLIEINPFFDMTDPCMFTWKDGGDFDGTFRFTRATP